MSVIQVILDKITTTTGITPVVKGGNRSQPIEYVYSREGTYNYRLELYYNGVNKLQVESVEERVHKALQDFGDTTMLSVCSIDSVGGGSFDRDNIVTYARFYEVVDYTQKPDVPIVPSGTIVITDNGVHNVRPYEYAYVDVISEGTLIVPDAVDPTFEDVTYDPHDYPPVEGMIPSAFRSFTVNAIALEEVPNSEGVGVKIGKV